MLLNLMKYEYDEIDKRMKKRKRKRNYVGLNVAFKMLPFVNLIWRTHSVYCVDVDEEVDGSGFWLDVATVVGVNRAVVVVVAVAAAAAADCCCNISYLCILLNFIIRNGLVRFGLVWFSLV
jgi:hypothetical protein